ncbi:MAG TPA: IS1 family transposase [Candidatus Tectomicrobia bacterium]
MDLAGHRRAACGEGRALCRGTRSGRWHARPAVYRQRAVAYTDVWASSAEIVPASRHRAVGKATGGTRKIERFNHTRRQRISRLARKTLSFAKKLRHPIGAIWLFVHHDNARWANSQLRHYFPWATQISKKRRRREATVCCRCRFISFKEF